jgi:hypothetical protein
MKRGNSEFVDETGNEYGDGRLVVLGFHSLGYGQRARFLVLCRPPCNRTFVAYGTDLRLERTKQCHLCRMKMLREKKAAKRCFTNV